MTPYQKCESCLPGTNVAGIVRLAGVLLPAGLEAMTWNV